MLDQRTSGSASLQPDINWTSPNYFDQSNNQEIRLKGELADARLLQKISTELIQEDDTAGLYKKIVTAVVSIMGSQFGTMQILYPDPGTIGKLRLLAAYGFDEASEKYWEWVYAHTGSSCGEVLRTQKRVIIPNYATCEFMQDQPTLSIFLNAGIYAAQSTPLYSRSGEFIGMISTHWDKPHTPSERDLYMLDVLARQAADLIERTQAAEALRKSEERLRALTSATNDIIFRMSADWKEMYSLDGSNFLKDNGVRISDWFKKYVHPHDYGIVKSAIQRAIDTKQTLQLEHRVLKVNNAIGWTLLRVVPIRNDEGEIIEWFGAASDITDKKTLMNTLEETVKERTKELQRSNDDLQQFAHVASHDLKEPVRKIMTFGHRLEDEIANGSNEKQKLYTQKILESADRMSTMIEGVLRYSSLNSVQENIEIIDINRILIDIQTDLEVLIEMKKASISFAELPVITGSTVLIYQLFYNLINNSLKFSREGIKPKIAIESQTFSSDAVDYVRITVIDNGIGFDEKFSSQIFQTFTRLNAKSKYDGTGLGLSLAKKIVERHQGTIEAKSTLNVGSSFTITLPLTQTVNSLI